MTTTTSDVNLTLIDPQDQRRLVTQKMTIDNLQRMIEMGVIEERPSWELLDGMIVRVDKSAAGEDPMTISPGHVMAVERLLELRPRFRPHGCHLRTQAPIELPPYNMPEPDGCIVIGDIDRYSRRHPRPEDILCVIEVADASLLTDRRRKLRLYAQFGLPMYVILNLPKREAEVHAEPVPDGLRYGRSEVLASESTLRLPMAGDQRIEVAVHDLLPAT